MRFLNMSRTRHVCPMRVQIYTLFMKYKRKGTDFLHSPQFFRIFAPEKKKVFCYGATDEPTIVPT